jgi:eukaryotic-like serine/threonine-protein kinase
MGEVYEVIHLGLRKPFALKCLKETALEDERAAQRFVKEIRGLAAVHSGFVVAICDCGWLENGSPYFVMERLRGQDLRKVLLELDSLAPLRTIKLCIDACLGLQAVHDAGMVHRDLKPENLFITYGEDDSERCKVLDFGIAKTVGTGSTKQHSLIGTLKYMAPEQIADPSSVGPATDIYSLGAIAYECLAGRPPHVAETEPELMFKIMNGELAPLASLVPSLDPTLCAVVARALHRDPERRYASAVTLAGALASCLVAYGDERTGESSMDHEGLPLKRPSPRHRRTWTLAGLSVGLVLGVALGAGFAGQSGGSSAVAARRPAPSAARSGGIAPTAPISDPLAPVSTLEPPAQHPPPPERSSPPPSTALRSRTAVAPTRNVRPTLPAIDDRNPYE